MSQMPTDKCVEALRKFDERVSNIPGDFCMSFDVMSGGMIIGFIGGNKKILTEDEFRRMRLDPEYARQVVESLRGN